eukprot:scaffold16050_cov121-Isochrysis_galbana.AAC.5
MPLACLLFLPFVRLLDFHFFFPFQHRIPYSPTPSLCALPTATAADWLVCERTSCSTVFWPRRLRFFEWIHPSTDQEVLDGFVPPVASR